MDEELLRERFSRVYCECYRKGRRDRRAAEKFPLKFARSGEKLLLQNPKESLSPPGSGLHMKLGVGTH